MLDSFSLKSGHFVNGLFPFCTHFIIRYNTIGVIFVLITIIVCFLTCDPPVFFMHFKVDFSTLCTYNLVMHFIRVNDLKYLNSSTCFFKKMSDDTVVYSTVTFSFWNMPITSYLHLWVFNHNVKTRNFQFMWKTSGYLLKPVNCL